MGEGKIVLRVRGKGCMSIYGLRGAPTSNSPFHVTMICNALCLHPEGCAGLGIPVSYRGPWNNPQSKPFPDFLFLDQYKKGYDM